MTAPPGALPVFPHCRSSVCSRRSAIYISPLPQQCPLPQEPSQYFPTAAAVPAPAGAPSISPHCRSSVCSHRSAIYISPLPQQCPLPQEPFRTSPLPQQCLLPQELHQYLPTAAAVSTLTSSFLSPRCHSSTLQQKPLLPPRCRSIITSGVQHPISPKPCNFWGGLSATIWLLSHDKHFLGPGQMPSSDPSPRARELLPSSEPSPRTARQIRIPFIQFIIKCELVKQTMCIFTKSLCTFTNKLRAYLQKAFAHLQTNYVHIYKKPLHIYKQTTCILKGLCTFTNKLCAYLQKACAHLQNNCTFTNYAYSQKTCVHLQTNYIVHI